MQQVENKGTGVMGSWEQFHPPIQAAASRVSDGSYRLRR
jgi:hypothetical protein